MQQKQIVVDNTYKDNGDIVLYGVKLSKTANQKLNLIFKVASFLKTRYKIKKRIVLYALDFEQHLTEKISSGTKLYGFMNQSGYVFINIRSSKKELVELLCHELRHVQQYQDGYLESINDHTTFIWKGKTYNCGDMMDVVQKDYEYYTNLPWEKEAFRSEQIWAPRVNTYLKSLKNKKKK